MKKISILFTLTVLSFCYCIGQTVRASIGIGSTPNSVKIYIRPDITLTGVNIGTLQFNLGISSLALPTATATVSSTTSPFLAPSNWSVVRSTDPEGGYYHYSIFTIVSPITINTVANTEMEVMEIAFSDGSIIPQNVSLVCLPDGGNIQTGLFYFTSTVLNSDGSSLFYARNSNVLVTNLLSYTLSGLPGVGISTATIAGVILPTKFLSFFATKSNDDAKLTWNVENEENNNYFEVEASVDGRSFKTVQRVNALRNGRSSNAYTTSDINIARYSTKTIYYRIKQVEADGHVVYSEVRQLNLTDKNFSASLYPNPVKTITKLVVDAPEATKATILVRDANGKTVQHQSVQLVKGINQQQIDATLFAAGDYSVTIMSDKLNQTIKMTKAN